MSATRTERFVTVGSGVRLCHVTDGPPDGVPLLLIAGLGQHLHAWPQPLVDLLAARGLRVVRFDNRDAGRSGRAASAPPARWRRLTARPRPDAYTLTDMAQDAVDLLDHLEIDRVHLAGMSMGGMIAQVLTCAHPDRVLTLTSLISTTGDARCGQPAWSTKLRLARPPAKNREAWTARHLAMTAHLAGTGHPPDESEERAYAHLAWDRSHGGPKASAAGVARQIQAIQASGDRTAPLRRIRTPTLVVHGDRDLIVHPSGGRATAAAIPGARLVTVPGMGHHLAPGLLTDLAEFIGHHTQGVTA